MYVLYVKTSGSESFCIQIQHTTRTSSFTCLGVEVIGTVCLNLNYRYQTEILNNTTNVLHELIYIGNLICTDTWELLKQVCRCSIKNIKYRQNVSPERFQARFFSPYVNEYFLFHDLKRWANCTMYYRMCY